MFSETILLSLREICRNLMRSTLTILGIVIGVAAVITMVTLGRGVTAQVASDIAKLGTNLLQVRPGQERRGHGGAHSISEMFKAKDAEAIAQEVFGLSAVAPIASQTIQSIYGNENWSTTVTGSTNAYLQVSNWIVESGRQFLEGELRAGKAVCVLGATVCNKLFGGQNPIGATIRLGKLSCNVIGVLNSKGQSSFGTDRDDFVLIPLRMLQRRITGNPDVSRILVSAHDGVSTKKVKQDIEQLMRERRHISPGKDNDFYVRDMQELVSTMTGTTRVLTGLLGAVAAVSLLVGGIGIMNIMLVSVTERTREIGIRLAIGALERDVLMQFLVEAVVLSSFGGVIGIVLGIAAAAVGTIVLAVPFVFDPVIIVIAFVFSAAVGVVFGYFPARQAGQMDPIEALRYE
ncbi:MAG: ABC transporter permease [Deltaproteobacteria bacterium]|nr:ABC transporter permease [Deltaproteobacteria bacterium]